MLLGGDEFGRTQGGNNNAYCQDNEISWVDWSGADASLLAFVRRLVALRRSHPVFRRHRYLTGVEAAELGWFTPAGTPMTVECWNDPEALAIGVYLDGSDAPDVGPDGRLLLDDDFLVLVNGWWEPLEFTIGDCRPGQAGGGLAWRVEIDTFDPARAPVEDVAAAVDADVAPLRAGDRVTVGPRSVVVLRGPGVSGDLRDSGDSAHPAHRAAVAMKAWVRERFGQLTAALASEDLAARPELLADQLSLVMEGTYASAQALSAAGPARHARTVAESLLDVS